MEAAWQRQWVEYDRAERAAGRDPNRKEFEQQKIQQKLMRLAVEIFEQRRYLGTIEVSWMFGIYQESALIWVDEEGDGGGPDPLLNDDSSAAKTLRQLIARMETRAKNWDDPFFREKSSRDPRLGATGTIGINLFGIVGWQVSVTCSIYASTLLRYMREKDEWPLGDQVERYAPSFNAIASGGFVDGAALRGALEAKAQTLPAALASAPREALRDAWHLADYGKDGKLDMEEYALFLHLIELAPGGLPRDLPEALVPPSARSGSQPKAPPPAPAAAAAGAAPPLDSEEPQVEI